jgi:hypothetical protein
LCRNLQADTLCAIAYTQVITESVNTDGYRREPGFHNPLKPAVLKSALPMRRTAKTPQIWLPKLHLSAERGR